jgi:hypothetical protein
LAPWPIPLPAICNHPSIASILCSVVKHCGRAET